MADKLKVVLDGVAVISRPRKTATIRLVGLDYSVTKEKVMSAVANIGGCPADAISVSDILLGPRGMMSAVVRCPCDLAKKIVDKGRILVGWTSASVRILEERPLRCYRCLGLGHIRSRCPSETVREHLCFRCGCEGLKAYTCKSELRCIVCTDAKKPACHLMGGADCHPPPVKGTEAPGIGVTGVRGRQSQAEGAMSL